MSRLFSLGSTASSAGTIGDRNSDDTNNWTSALLDDSALAAVGDLPEFMGTPTQWPSGGQLDPELFIDWETVNISHWDNFPFRV